MKPTLKTIPKSTNPNIGRYRHIFYGQEADNETFGEVTNFGYEFRQYDSRLGRRWNVDLVFKGYESPYACFAGNPVWLNDPLGKSSWKPDSGALAQNNEVCFIAEMMLNTSFKNRDGHLSLLVYILNNQKITKITETVLCFLNQTL